MATVNSIDIMKRAKNRMNKIGRVLSAWETVAADQSFAGMTLEQFKAAIQPALAARDRVTELRCELTGARQSYDRNSKGAHDTALLVVNAVKGHPDRGEDSSLYAAMGYVRKSARQSGLTRKSSPQASPPPMAEAV